MIDNVWKTIEYPDILDKYEISNNGVVRLMMNNKYDEMPIYSSFNGREFVSLITTSGTFKFKIIAIDILVAKMFCKLPENCEIDDCDIIHLNGDITNSSYDNLKPVLKVEAWKIVKYDNVLEDFYEVSSFGNIRLIDDKTPIKISNTKKGYLGVGLKGNDGHTHRHLVHRIVATAFVDNPNGSPYVNHIDGVKFNNYYKNLEWCTNRDNCVHAILTGLHYKSSTASIIKRICELLVSPEIDGSAKLTQLAMKEEGYGEITISTIECVKYKKCWTQISDRYFDTNYFHKKTKTIDEKTVIRICELLVESKYAKPTEIVQKLNDEGIHNITTYDVSGIKHKHSWRRISDKYFSDDYFPNISTVLTEDIVRHICDLLTMDCTKGRPILALAILQYEGFNNIKIHHIVEIKNKRAWVSISDEYFK